jgi:hypothetical protein
MLGIAFTTTGKGYTMIPIVGFQNPSASEISKIHIVEFALGCNVTIALEVSMLIIDATFLDSPQTSATAVSLVKPLPDMVTNDMTLSDKTAGIVELTLIILTDSTEASNERGKLPGVAAV